MSFFVFVCHYKFDHCASSIIVVASGKNTMDNIT